MVSVISPNTGDMDSLLGRRTKNVLIYNKNISYRETKNEIKKKCDFDSKKYERPKFVSLLLSFVHIIFTSNFLVVVG